MNILEVTQGSAQWHAARAQHFCASEAPAMMGVSPYTPRSELLRQKATGIAPEVDAPTQARFDAGHADEAERRPKAEEIIGGELYPVTGTLVVESLALLASLDGINLDDTEIWENKHPNKDTAKHIDMFGEPPEHHIWQLEHQLLVSGARRALFTCGDAHCWYESDARRRRQLIAGWKQFAADLATYVPVAPAEKVRAEPVEDFPVMAPITMTGDVAVQHELDTFKAKLKAHLAQLPRDPKTDQEFANLEDSVKRRDALEKALKAERERALRGSPNIAQLLNAIDELLAMSKESRLADAEKVTAKKEAMRLEIRNAAQADFDAHVRGWNERLGRPLLSTSKGTCPDAAIAQGMHGKKSVKGWREGAAAAVTAGKIAVALLGEKVEANLAAYKELCSGSEALFRDIDTLLFKDTEAFRVICAGRIEEAKRQEEARLEAERARIRTEEEARARAQAAREQQEREAAERREREEQEAAARREREQAEALQRQQEQVAAAPAPVLHPHGAAAAEAHALFPNPQPTAYAQAPAVIAMPTRVVPAVDTGARVTLGQINARIAPLSITVAGLLQVGFPHVGKEKAAFLFRESDLEAIRDALIRHLEQIPLAQAA